MATGDIDNNSGAYQPVFASLSNISAAKTFDVHQLQGDGLLYATNDFIRTVEPTAVSHLNDAYLRSVQWILTPVASTDDQLVSSLVVSPFEAQSLMTKLPTGSATTLHIFKPYWNQGLPALNRLESFHFPPTRVARIPSPSIMAELNIFAGRAYFDKYQEYVDACRFLRLAHENSKAGLVTANDGFILEDDQDSFNVKRSPHQSPVAFIHSLLDIRAHHHDLTKSHMGKLLEGSVLRASDIKVQSS